MNVKVQGEKNYSQESNSIFQMPVKDIFIREFLFVFE